MCKKLIALFKLSIDRFFTGPSGMKDPSFNGCQIKSSLKHTPVIYIPVPLTSIFDSHSTYYPETAGPNYSGCEMRNTK